MKKSNIFDKETELHCAYCGKNLLENINLSMVIIATDNSDNIVKVIPCCKKDCDHKLTRDLPTDVSDGWEELSIFTNPYLYLKHIMAMLNNMYDGAKFLNEEAFENYKEILLAMAPYVMRDMTDGEISSAKLDDSLQF